MRKGNDCKVKSPEEVQTYAWGQRDFSEGQALEVWGSPILGGGVESGLEVQDFSLDYRALCIPPQVHRLANLALPVLERHFQLLKQEKIFLRSVIFLLGALILHPDVLKRPSTIVLAKNSIREAPCSRRWGRVSLLSMALSSYLSFKA